MRRRLVEFAVAALIAAGSDVQAACPPVALDSPQYAEATRLVEQLPEYRAWQSYVAAHPPAKVAIGLGDSAESVPIAGRCHVSVTLYSDEGTHFHRWNTFYVSLQPRRVQVSDLEGNPVSLQAWRRRNRVR